MADNQKEPKVNIDDSPILDDEETTRIAQVLVIIGAVAALISVAALVFGRWRDLGAAGQVGVLAGFTAMSGVAGAWLLRRDNEWLRQAGSIVWMLTVALVYGTCTLVTKNYSVVPSGASPDVARGLPWLVRALPSFIVAIVLIARERRIPQLLGVVLSGLATALASYAMIARPTPASSGMLIAGVGAVTLLLAWLDELQPRIVAESLGAGLIALGTTLPDYVHSTTLWAPVVGAGAGAALLVSSIPARSHIARALGILMTAVFALQAIFQVARSPFALLATGAILIAGGVGVARLIRRSNGRARPSRDPLEL